MFSNAFFLVVLLAVAGATARDDYNYNYGGDNKPSKPVLAAPSPSSSALSSAITSAAISSSVSSVEASSSIVSREASSSIASSSAIETASASESVSETSSATSESITSTSATKSLGETDCAAPTTVVRTVTVHDGKQSTKTVTVHDGGKPTQVPNGQTGIKDGGNGQGQTPPPPNNGNGNGQGQTRPPPNNGNGNNNGGGKGGNNGNTGGNNGGAGNNNGGGNGGAGNNTGGGKGNGNNNGGRPPKSTTTVTVDPTPSNTRGNQGATTTSKAGNGGNGGNGGGKTTSTAVADPTKTRGNGGAGATTTSKAGNGGGGQIKSTSTVVVDPTSTAGTGNGNGNGNGQGGDATGTATSADPTATANPGQGGGNTGGNDGGDPQSSLNLLPELVQPNQAKDGQETPTVGQVASLKSTNNFINFCATQKDVPLTDGQQIVGGSCNPTPMGRIVAKAKMPSAKFVNPKNFDTIPANQPFTIQMNIKNMETGHFTNPDKTYFGAPAQVNGDGIIIGHSHVTVQRVNSLTDTTPADPTVFEFFKGMNGKAQNGVLTADVTKGLQPGTYRLSSINAAANHQVVLGAVAQRGALDDAVYFTVE